MVFVWRSFYGMRIRSETPAAPAGGAEARAVARGGREVGGRSRRSGQRATDRPLRAARSRPLGRVRRAGGDRLHRDGAADRLLPARRLPAHQRGAGGRRRRAEHLVAEPRAAASPRSRATASGTPSAVGWGRGCSPAPSRSCSTPRTSSGRARFYERHGSKTIVIARFVPIIRTFAPVVAGVGQMEYRRFVFYNVAGGIGWVTSMTWAGYLLGSRGPEHRRPHPRRGGDRDPALR